MKLAITPSGLIDLAKTDGALDWDDSLQSAVLISLLTDRRANADDALPDAPIVSGPLPPDRRGWCGDALAENDERIGSRLWLLTREKKTEETRRRAEFYAREALQWLIDDKHVTAIEVTAEWAEHGRLNHHVVITLPAGGTYDTTVQTGGIYALAS